MVWDLRAALLRKEEAESARLQDFAFRLRVRTFRLLGERIDGLAGAAIADNLATASEERLIAIVLEADPTMDRATLDPMLAQARAEAGATGRRNRRSHAASARLKAAASFNSVVSLGSRAIT
jgi:hypothetical protein